MKGKLSLVLIICLCSYSPVNAKPDHFFTVKSGFSMKMYPVYPLYLHKSRGGALIDGGAGINISDQYSLSLNIGWIRYPFYDPEEFKPMQPRPCIPSVSWELDKWGDPSDQVNIDLNLISGSKLRSPWYGSIGLGITLYRRGTMTRIIEYLVEGDNGWDWDNPLRRVEVEESGWQSPSYTMIVGVGRYLWQGSDFALFSEISFRILMLRAIECIHKILGICRWWLE
ncbi:MAG: hypothetical protein P9M15_03975 [Candidatus Electryoneaceae bacterium]|nr:hypothetical protein [Candidatus Electryoneaceae bacterium]